MVVMALLIFSLVVVPAVALGQSGSVKSLSATVQQAEEKMAQIDSHRFCPTGI
ncbi:MAG: hypothetical protein ACLSAP_12255 [Oscillospiraceae bacterium]